MKKFKKAILSVLVLFYLGITITITIPDEIDIPGDSTVQTLQDKPGMKPVGPFGDDETDKH